MTGNVEPLINKQVFERYLQKSQNIKERVIYGTLLYCIQNPDKQSLEKAIKYLEEAIKDRLIKNPNEEFRTLINFSDDNGNTLLHHAVKKSNTDAITTLLEYGANPLIRNAEIDDDHPQGKIPLDLATDDTKNVLIESMTKQASQKRENARDNSLMLGFMPGSFLGAGLGIAICFAASLSGAAAVFGTIIVPVLVIGIAVGLATYFLSQNHKEVRAITIEVSSVKPACITPEIQQN